MEMKFRGLQTKYGGGICGKTPALYWQGEKDDAGWIECSIALCQNCYKKIRGIRNEGI
jgi:hypothetical protein